MIITESEEVACDGESARYLRDAVDEGDVCICCELEVLGLGPRAGEWRDLTLKMVYRMRPIAAAAKRYPLLTPGGKRYSMPNSRRSMGRRSA